MGPAPRPAAGGHRLRRPAGQHPRRPDAWRAASTARTSTPAASWPSIRSVTRTTSSPRSWARSGSTTSRCCWAPGRSGGRTEAWPARPRPASRPRPLTAKFFGGDRLRRRLGGAAARSPRYGVQATWSTPTSPAAPGKSAAAARTSAAGSRATRPARARPQPQRRWPATAASTSATPTSTSCR